MIILDGLKFAENENEFIDSLFHTGSTCVGYAERFSNKVVLYDAQMNEIGYIDKYCISKKNNTVLDGLYVPYYDIYQILADLKANNITFND